ncbi:hypothetical protein FACS1894211_01210 [Clostridia bacterium]|nr:hypothetical protein FACS1894211_01210 [Clostridia bacterium]
MKKMKKKIMAILLAVLAGLPLFACGDNGGGNGSGNGSGNVPKGAPDYSADISSKVMEIGGWVSPPQGNWGGRGNPDFVTQERFDEIAEAGLNSIIQIYYEWNPNAPDSKTIKALEYAHNAGIKMYVRHTGLDAMIDETPEYLQTWAENYRNLPAFAGHMATDEPSADRYDNLALVKTIYEQAFPGKTFYVNLFPALAGSRQTGRSKYEDYISEYISKLNPDFLSFDNYPLLTDGFGTPELTGDYLYNLEIVANQTKAAGIPFWDFVQAMSYDGSTRMPNLEELRWLIYSSMAYGVQGVQYFCYWTPLEFAGDEDSKAALITKDGRRTPTYDYAKTINAELAAFDHVYLNYEWQGTMTFVGTKNVTGMNKNFKMLKTPLASSPRIKSLTAEQDTIVGAFKDKDGYDGFLVQNFADATYKKDDAVSITFNNADKAILYRKGQPETVALTNGVCNLTLEPGEGAFIIPIQN